VLLRNAISLRWLPRILLRCSRKTRLHFSMVARAFDPAALKDDSCSSQRSIPNVLSREASQPRTIGARLDIPCSPVWEAERCAAIAKCRTSCLNWVSNVGSIVFNKSCASSSHAPRPATVSALQTSRLLSRGGVEPFVASILCS
jgi:hypothetical protein